MAGPLSHAGVRRSLLGPARGARTGAALAGLAGLFLWLGGLACTEDVRTDLPSLPVFQGIRGRVYVAGEGQLADLRVKEIEGRFDDGLAFEARSDSSGVYALPLPEGRYRLACAVRRGTSSGQTYFYSRGGPTDFAGADTLDLSRGQSLQADFHFGRLDLRVAMPPSLVHTSVPFVAYALLREDDWDEVAYQTVSSASDTYRASLWPLPPGPCRVRVQYYGERESFWLPGVSDPESAAIFTVGAGSAPPRDVTLQVEEARLRGTVPSSWDAHGLRNASVRAFSSDSIPLVGVAVDGESEFELVFYTPGAVRLLLEVSNVERWLGGPGFENATEFGLRPGETTTVPPIGDGGLDVRLDVPLDWPLRPAFTIVYEDGSRLTAYPHFVGSFDRILVPNLEPGTCRVRIHPVNLGREPWLPIWYENAETEEQATPIEVPSSGAYARLRVRPVEGGRIEGRVVGVSRPDWTGLVLLSPAAAPGCWARDFVDRDSPGFRFLGVPDGEYRLGVRVEYEWFDCDDLLEQPIVWYGQTASWDSASVIAVRDHQAIGGLEIHLE